MFTKRKFAHIFLSVIVLLSMTVSSIRPSSVSAQEGDGIQREFNAETGKVSFIDPENGRVLPASEALNRSLASRSADPALALAKRFAPEFGLANPEQDLSEMKSNSRDDGRLIVRYQQNYQGIPVIGGELIVNTNESGDLYSMNGEVSPDISLQTQPEVAPEQATESALQAVAKWYQKTPADFVASEPALWIFDESLLHHSTRPVELVWRMEVTSKDKSLPVRELVLVNAHRGGISLHFNQIDNAWSTMESSATEVSSPNITTPKMVDSKAIVSTTKSTRDLMPNLLGATWYVATTGNDSNDCATTSTPCATINSAIGKAANGDVVNVSIGTYTGSGDAVVLINKDVTLSGGWNTNFTIQDGVSTIDGKKTRRGVTVNNNITTTMDRFIIQNGFASIVSPWAGRVGGGIYNQGTLTLTLSLINENKADFAGGIFNNGTLTLNSSTISNNTVGSEGGGGIFNSDYNAIGMVTLNNSTVTGNRATAGGFGGGIYTFGTFILNNSTVSGNTAYAEGGGGGGILSGGILVLNNSTVSSNTTTNYYPCPSGTASSGGGIYASSGNVNINNSTIINNIASNCIGFGGYGGGVYNYSGVVSLQNTIIANNYASLAGPDCRGAINSSGYNLLGNNSDCTFSATTGDLVGATTAPINPNLNTLQDNGGATFTHALGIGSPAINAGNPAAPGSGGNACLATDQRATARPVDSRCDIGAYEGSVPWVSPPLVNTYTTNNSTTLPGSLLCTESTLNCTNGSNPHADSAHKYAIGTYNFYATQFNRDSIDNNGMVIISTVQYCNPDFACPYANAYWEGTQMVYGSAYGFANADDIVAHEYTHGVTQYESNLFYFYQSGAINESFSDLWGEYYDQTNGLGNDTPAVKWLLGEDVTGLGAMRNMKNPGQFGDPDKMTSSKYRKGSADSGGVHHNSGVNNKAVYLMVDGGTFNNKTVIGIGWEKTAVIYYEVNTNLLTSGSDYSDLYYALQQACINVTGQIGITSDDCIQVKNALLAVEMNKQPVSSFNPDAPLCPSNMSTDPSLVLYEDDFESGDSNWTLQNAWSLEDWYANSSTHMLYGDDYLESNDSSLTMQTGVDLPAGSKTFLHFDHAFLLDYTAYQGKNYYFDGGVLEYSIDNGDTWKDAKPLFSAGQNYKGTVFNYPGTTNTLKGRSAFVGDSHGYVSSLYNLGSLAGQTVRFRWRLGTDNTVAFFGWFVDDVQIYTCIPIPSKPVLKSPASNALVKDYTPDLDWSDSTPTPDHYQLQIATDSKFNSLVYDETSLPTSDFTVPADLDPNTKYYWRARAFNSINSPGAWSKAFSFRAVILPPVLLTPTDEEIITSRKPILDWDNVAGATKYNIQVSTKQTFSTKLFDASPTNSTYKIPSNLPSGKTIYWRVRAIGPNGPSNWSTFSLVTP